MSITGIGQKVELSKLKISRGLLSRVFKGILKLTLKNNLSLTSIGYQMDP